MRLSNHAGWLTSKTVDQPGLVSTTLSNTFDLNGRRTIQKADFTINSVTTHDFQNEYGYDGRNRLTGLKQTVQGSGSGYSVVANKYVTFGYNGQDQLIDIDRYASTTTSNLVAHTDYDRDFLGRITKIDTYKGATHFATYDLAYDARSRITAIDSVFSNSAWNEDHDFTYDHTDQLKTANHSVQDDEAYNFDLNGNRSGNQTHLGATNSSTVIADNRISSDGVYNYTWDDEGNMLTKVSIATGDKEEYSWDHRNRLILVTFKNSSNVVTKTIEFVYDHGNLMLRRIETPYSSGSPGTSEMDLLVHDGNQIVLVFHRTGSGTASLTNRYLWGPQQDLLLADEQVTSLGSAGTVYWAFLNQVGSVVDLATYNAGTDTTTIVKHRKYDSFGNITADSAPSIKQRFAFTGKWFEESFGSTWHIFRWYDTFLGKWKSQDPIKDGENWSAYVENRPTYATDPSGLQSPGRQWWNDDWTDTINWWARAMSIGDRLGQVAGMDLVRQRAMTVDRQNSIGWAIVDNDCPIDQMRIERERGLNDAKTDIAVAKEGAVATVEAVELTTEVVGTVRAVPSLARGAGRIAGRVRPSTPATAPRNVVSPQVQKYLEGSGGRWGGKATRQLNHAEALKLEGQGYRVTNGAGRGSEEWIRGPGGGTSGGTWVDITATNGTKTIRVQTVTTCADGVTPIASEAAAAARIRAAFPNDTLIIVSKQTGKVIP